MKAGKLKDIVCIVCNKRFLVMDIVKHTCFRDCISSDPNLSNKLCSEKCAKIHEEEYHSSIDIT